jgi:hypothetical protein
VDKKSKPPSKLSRNLGNRVSNLRALSGIIHFFGEKMYIPFFKGNVKDKCRCILCQIANTFPTYSSEIFTKS